VSTPAQLRDRLKELGIKRSLRTLTNWRSEGLLPPLSRVGRGRARGVRRAWEDDVLDQAISVHCLLTDRARTEDALLRLWFSGYPVDADRAKETWGGYLKRQRNAMEKAASGSPDGYLGIGKTLWRVLGKPEPLRDIVMGVIESLFDDAKRDDEDFRASSAWVVNGAPQDGRETLSGDDAYKIVLNILSPDGRANSGSRSIASGTAETSTAVRESIQRCLELVRGAIDYISDDEDAPHDRAYKVVDRSWEKFGTGLFLANRDAIDFVQSITAHELNETRASLASIRSIVARCVELTTGPVERTLSVRIQVAVLGSLGHYLAPQLVAFGRLQPTWPIAQTILALRDFVMRVQSTDIARKDNNYRGSARVINAWTTTQQELSRLWAAVEKNSGN
jgi:hypothetical protein